MKINLAQRKRKGYRSVMQTKEKDSLAGERTQLLREEIRLSQSVAGPVESGLTPEGGQNLDAMLIRKQAAKTLGKVKSEKKAKSSRENGRKGGRPRTVQENRIRMRRQPLETRV